MPQISAQLGDAALRQFEEDGVVCPFVLRKGLFTTSAMDNIDHNPTANISSHGTNIYVSKHPTSDLEGEVCEPLNVKLRDHKATKIQSYQSLSPMYRLHTYQRRTYFLRSTFIIILPTTLPIPLHIIDYKWLKKVSLAEEIDGAVNVTWSAHHAAFERGCDFKVSITSRLTLVRDLTHSVATIHRL